MAERKEKLPTAKEILQTIGLSAPEEARLQRFDHAAKQLWMVCGDGAKAVEVGSNGGLEISSKPLRSRLPKDLPDDLSARGDSLGGDRLLAAVLGVLRLNLHFEDARLHLLLAIWVIASYLYSVFSHFGYFFFHSKRHRCGKTRCLEMLHHLAYEAGRPLNSATPAVIRERACDGRTLLLDTVERWKAKNQEAFAAIMELLDAGFRNGGMAAKMVLTPAGNWVTRDFPAFAPYAVGGIGRHSLSETALDRSFPVELIAKPRSVKLKRYYFNKTEQQCEPMRRQIYLWTMRKAETVSEVYESEALELDLEPLALNDRAFDIWKPLFAVLRVLGFDASSQEWTDLASVAVAMHRDPEIAEIQEQIELIRVLRHKAVDGKVVGTTTEIIDGLTRWGLDLDQTKFRRFLSDWEFEQKMVRLDTGPRRAWELTNERLEELLRELEQELPLGGLYTLQR